MDACGPKYIFRNPAPGCFLSCEQDRFEAAGQELISLFYCMAGWLSGNVRNMKHSFLGRLK